ncbi:hypothetical protein EN45_068640 [Penicillium chrysogenum]|uniref:Rhodopsin domain-containing protein n=1 Tax=Penicillium chrysogenum TaxID=5076 RepID=A0A167THY0_PENCH|nr:hypothetical protein EN45_068640 [Penicillium chrysogenum]
MGADWNQGHQQPYSGNGLVGPIAAIAAVQTVFVAAKFYTRFMQRVKFDLDDYLILLALVASLACSIIFIVLAEIGVIGYHFDYVSEMPDKVILARKCTLALEILDYPFTITPAKLAVLLFYLRIFTTRKFQILVYIIGSLVLALGVSVLLENFLQCRPFPYIWDRSIPGGTCIHPVDAYRVFAPVNVLTGVLILVIPIPAVWNLHVPKAHKVAVTGVFLLGGLGNVASISKMVINFAESDFARDDPTWFAAKYGVLTILEGSLIIIAACIISIWPLFTQFMPRRFRTTFARSTPRRSQHRSWYSRAHPQKLKVWTTLHVPGRLIY